jgi:hypothetical protein
MASDENSDYGNYEDDVLDGGGGGYYPYDPNLIPGYQNVMGGDPYQNVGYWADNPGYDPSLQNLPMGSAGTDPNLTQLDPAFDPNTPTFSATGTYSPGQDPTTPNIGEAPAAPSYQPDPFPGGVGNGIPSQSPQPGYPPPATFTTGGPVRGTPGPTPQPSPTPAPGKPSAPPTAKTSAPTPTNNTSFNIGGMPPISTNLPGEQKFTYQPISIGRQGAPNPSAAPFQQQNPQQADPYGAMSVGNPLNPYNRLAQDQQKQKPYGLGL